MLQNLRRLGYEISYKIRQSFLHIVHGPSKNETINIRHFSYIFRKIIFKRIFNQKYRHRSNRSIHCGKNQS